MSTEWDEAASLAFGKLLFIDKPKSSAHYHGLSTPQSY